MQRSCLRQAILALAGLLLFVGSAPDWYAQSTSEQEPSTGPAPEVGPTVLAPKKTQPPPPETEKKPERINPNEIFTLSTATNLVNVDVLVLDKDGTPVPNLNRTNFKIYDDGVPQTVSNFGTAEAPMTTCMLIEFSNKYWAFLYLALRYAYGYLQFIQPKDWTAVVSFDMKPQILTDFTQDRNQVRGALDTLRIPGFMETNLYDALSFTLDRMKDIKGRKSILVICTGFDTFSKLTYDQILKVVRSSDTVIYPVSILEFLSVRNPRLENINSLQARNALETIAKYSGGQAYFPRFEGELGESSSRSTGNFARSMVWVSFPPTPPRTGSSTN